MTIAVAFPVLHFALHALGALDEAVRPAREVAMLVWLLLMATVAIVQHRLLEASRRRLESDSSSLAAEISERRRLAAQKAAFLAELESRQWEIEARKAELERFNVTVSHDLRRPLITIQGLLEVMERALASGDARGLSGPIRRIETASGGMGRLLDELVEQQSAGRRPKHRSAAARDPSSTREA